MNCMITTGVKPGARSGSDAGAPRLDERPDRHDEEPPAEDQIEQTCRPRNIGMSRACGRAGDQLPEGAQGPNQCNCCGRVHRVTARVVTTQSDNPRDHEQQA